MSAQPRPNENQSLRERLANLKSKDLAQECRTRGIASGGSKDAMRHRIIAHEERQQVQRVIPQTGENAVPEAPRVEENSANLVAPVILDDRGIARPILSPGVLEQQGPATRVSYGGGSGNQRGLDFQSAGNQGLS